jgi:hypothetical protein
MFQMVSSGAQTLIHAEKRGSVLTGVVQRSLADMMQEHAVSDRNRWQDSIVAALDQIKKAAFVSENFPHAISFAGTTMSLLPQPAADSILPRSPVVSQLLASWLAPATAAAASVGPKKQQQPAGAGGSGVEAALGDNAGARGGGGRGRGRGRGGRGGSGQEAAAAVAAATAVDATVSDAGGSGVEAALGDNAGARGGGGRGRGRGRGGRGGADAP